ncbi:hypothetical protein QCA50_007253 [Cerrena zonata]|uniref:Uncharacterized protein n=1 Tax=Cerrena zonata TaxID=2478898 RepID=A0AAW0GJ23_9APHY
MSYNEPWFVWWDCNAFIRSPLITAMFYHFGRIPRHLIRLCTPAPSGRVTASTDGMSVATRGPVLLAGASPPYTAIARPHSTWLKVTVFVSNLSFESSTIGLPEALRFVISREYCLPFVIGFPQPFSLLATNSSTSTISISGIMRILF